MTERQIENRIKKLQAIEAQQKELEQQAEALKAEIKADLEEKGLQELKTKNGFIIRWKEIISSRLDGKALKASFPDIYSQFACRSAASPVLCDIPCIRNNCRSGYGLYSFAARVPGCGVCQSPAAIGAFYSRALHRL